MSIVNEFKLFRSTRSNRGTNTRLNSNAVSHLVTVLLPFYPCVRDMSAGERADFIIFLFEKALKDKMPDYKFSWEVEKNENISNLNVPFN